MFFRFTGQPTRPRSGTFARATLLHSEVCIMLRLTRLFSSNRMDGTVQKVSSSRQVHRRRRGRSRLWVERLESRALLATFNWILGADGSFSDPNNWLNTSTSLPGVPGPTDNASIPIGIVVSSAAIEALTVSQADHCASIREPSHSITLMPPHHYSWVLP